MRLFLIAVLWIFIASPMVAQERDKPVAPGTKTRAEQFRWQSLTARQNSGIGKVMDHLGPDQLQVFAGIEIGSESQKQLVELNRKYRPQLETLKPITQSNMDDWRSIRLVFANEIAKVLSSDQLQALENSELKRLSLVRLLLNQRVVEYLKLDAEQIAKIKSEVSEFNKSIRNLPKKHARMLATRDLEIVRIISKTLSLSQRRSLHQFTGMTPFTSARWEYLLTRTRKPTGILKGPEKLPEGVTLPHQFELPIMQESFQNSSPDGEYDLFRRAASKQSGVSLVMTKLTPGMLKSFFGDELSVEKLDKLNELIKKYKSELDATMNSWKQTELKKRYLLEIDEILSKNQLDSVKEMLFNRLARQGSIQFVLHPKVANFLKLTKEQLTRIESEREIQYRATKDDLIAVLVESKEKATELERIISSNLSPEQKEKYQVLTGRDEGNYLDVNIFTMDKLARETLGFQNSR